MTGIQFVTDEKGHKIAVQIDLKKHGAILEEFWDGLIGESRRNEKGIPLQKVKADLIRRGACVGKYLVEVKPAARKELEALPDPMLARIVRKLESLADTPRSAGSKKLNGYKDQWRIRIGDWRVVYFIDETVKLGKHPADRASARGLRVARRPSTDHPDSHSSHAYPPPPLG